MTPCLRVIDRLGVTDRRPADGRVGERARGSMAKSATKTNGSGTVTRADLAEAVYQKVGLARSESAEMVEAFLEEMSAALGRGESVKLSSFGTFLVRAKGERIGRNPKTGIEVPITPRRVMVFKPSNILKARVDGRPTEGLND